MERKKEAEFAEQLRVEQNLIEGREIKECISFIEESIIREDSPWIPLRLMCLLSLTQDGLQSKDYKSLVTQYLQSFGHDHIVTLFNLKKLGLLLEHAHVNPPVPVRPAISGENRVVRKMTDAVTSLPTRTSRSQFRTVAKRFSLVPTVTEGVYDVRNPPDSGYVFGGAYIPLICRIVEMLLLEKNINDDRFKLLPGEMVFPRGREASQISADNKVVLVYFIGGVTFAEISALRFLAKQKGLQIMIAATSVINGSSFMSQISVVNGK